MTLNIIGAGRLGKVLAKLFHEKKICIIQSVCNSSVDSAQNACDFIGSGQAVLQIKDMQKSDLTLIAAPDSHIAACAKQLSYLDESCIVFHCSGVLASTVLPKAAKRASIHPLKSFADSMLSFQSFENTYCTYEGDDGGILRAIFEKIGGIVLGINQDQKPLYHSAATIASNYTVTLFDSVFQCFIASGLTSDDALILTHSLMSDALENMKNLKSAKKALTGPIARGDAKTVERHINALSNTPYQKLYQILGCYTLELANLPSAKKKMLDDLLSHLKTSSNQS